jgi:serine protease inhibitor
MEGEIILPRFKSEYTVSLNEALQALGMAVAFDPDHADFASMCPMPSNLNIYIYQVKHRTYMQVNEEGTEAAAATAVGMKSRALMPMDTFTMIVDRPFCCAIRDNETGTILFLGSIVDPQ